MKAYLDLLSEVRHRGIRKEQRAVLLSDHSRPGVRSLFGRQIRFDLADGFPLVTTKKMPFQAVVHELIWFLRGETNIAYLQKHKVRIWDQWADANGDLGSCYPKHWRHFAGPNGPIDQIAALVEGIRETVRNPHASVARRLLLTAWHPADMPDPSVPTGCHTLAQFDVTRGKLSCQMYQRSADMFLGVPFNIASYAVLVHLLAKVCHLTPGEYIHTFGDAHIYENHLEQVDEQLTRTPLPLPTLKLDDSIDSIDDLDISQFGLEGYRSHPALRGEVAV